MTKAIMFLGTGSDVGKSLIVAGLSRAYARRGLKVAPFKPQNMSNNAAVASEGGEIGRAQALQARAAGVLPSVHMNPLLLKPDGADSAQVILQGKRIDRRDTTALFSGGDHFMPTILESFQAVAQNRDLVLIEGAGSPAEVNLRAGDRANLGFAQAANVPCLLIGDIHRGGVIASLVGTMAVLNEADRSLIKGFIINKFHGNVHLFDEGVRFLVDRLKLPCLGVVPHFEAARKLPAEDSMALEATARPKPKGVKICVLRLPHIANFDDLDPLAAEPGVTLSFLHQGEPIPGDARLVIIPGSKATVADLGALLACGWDIDLKAHHRRGGLILGLCGGYQMLGQTIHDPAGLEANQASAFGVGLLNVTTTLHPEKTTRLTEATHKPTGQQISGYEIHLGETAGPDCARPFATVGKRPEGAISPDGRIMGTYLHGCFAEDRFRAAFLKQLGAQAGEIAYEAEIESTLDALARHMETHLDLDRIWLLAGDLP